MTVDRVVIKICGQMALKNLYWQPILTLPNLLVGLI